MEDRRIDGPHIAAADTPEGRAIIAAARMADARDQLADVARLLVEATTYLTSLERAVAAGYCLALARQVETVKHAVNEQRAVLLTIDQPEGEPA